MKYASFVFILSMIGFLLFGAPGFAADPKLPVFDGKKAVATVDGEPITLEELNRAIAFSHTDRLPADKASRIDYSNIIKRLINTRLIVLEARNMGLDELPEIRRIVDQYSRDTLMELLLDGYVQGIKADENEVNRIYEDLVRELKIKSVRFRKEEDAKWIESQLNSGKDFDDVVKKAVEEGLAETDEKVEYINNQDLTRPIAGLTSTMEIGSRSPIVSVSKNRFIIFKLEDIRIPEVEDPEARRKAERQALNDTRVQAANNYYKELKAEYVKLDETLFGELDYESTEPGFEQLLQDKRVLAEIQGERPITVGDLTTAIKKKFFHGIELAIAGKRVKKQKKKIFEDMLQRRVLLKEALKQGIDQTDEYKSRVKAYENSVIFGAFVKKVVTPEIKLEIKDLETYYKENSQEYSSPQMMRINSIAFGKRADAEGAIRKLQKGTDFNWLSSNAPGQVDQNTKGLITFEGKLLTTRSLPEDIQKAVLRAKPGDFRLYTDSRGHFYVLHIYHVIPPEQKPFEEVRKDIAKHVYNEKIKQTVEQWADQLRAYYPVEIYRAEPQKVMGYDSIAKIA